MDRRQRQAENVPYNSGVLSRSLARIAELAEAIEDELGFCSEMITAIGASLGRSDRLLSRMFEPAHRLHLIVVNIFAGYCAQDLVSVVCSAANFAAIAPEFQAYLTRTCQRR